MRVKDGGGNNPIPLATPPSSFGGFMEYSFSVEIATKYGVEVAIIYKHILFWIMKNKAHNKNFRDGSYWTYFSINSLQSIFPFFSIKQLRTILDKMKEKEIIKVGNYNSQKYDRTLWYAFVEEPEDLKRIIPIGTEEGCPEKGKSICPNGQMELPETANGCSEKGKPIPYIKPYIKTDKIDNVLAPTKKFVKPTIEEIKSYCNEKGIKIDAERFYYYHDARGWMMGKYKMKNWKSAVRTWERFSSSKGSAANEFLELGRK